LGAVFESVEGAGWKVTYRNLRKELDSTRIELEATKGEVASTRQQADFIESAGVADLQPGTPVEEMRQLVRRYDSIREEKPSGPQRTREMTDVVRHLTILAGKLDNVDWFRYLHSHDGGERIAAYSYFYSRPHSEAASALTHALTTVENQPFGQYWAIRALARIAEKYPSSVRPQLSRLKELLEGLPARTDRYYELSRIINNLDPRT